ncbi:unnamed protein product [Meloidogyne enterolobii]|uniref:Uncharacterized protein n=1 Tax=Meloidogyne enterolobii TaxID=390850 RepID=A0ACB1A5M4_MELEN
MSLNCFKQFNPLCNKNPFLNRFSDLPLSRLPQLEKSLDLATELLNEEKRSSTINGRSLTDNNNPLLIRLVSNSLIKKFGGIKTKNDVRVRLFNSPTKPKSTNYRLVRISEDQNRQEKGENMPSLNRNIANPLLRQLWT